jgi:hypothetical protein
VPASASQASTARRWRGGEDVEVAVAVEVVQADLDARALRGERGDVEVAVAGAAAVEEGGVAAEDQRRCGRRRRGRRRRGRGAGRRRAGGGSRRTRGGRGDRGSRRAGRRGGVRGGRGCVVVEVGDGRAGRRRCGGAARSGRRAVGAAGEQQAAGGVGHEEVVLGVAVEVGDEPGVGGRRRRGWSGTFVRAKSPAPSGASTTSGVGSPGSIRMQRGGAVAVEVGGDDRVDVEASGIGDGACAGVRPVGLGEADGRGRRGCARRGRGGRRRRGRRRRWR